jgi:transposase InsO family protein
MPWKETCAVDERMRFVVECEVAEETMAALCREYGISRRSGYKWLGRFLAEGGLGLEDRSRAPKGHRNQVLPEVEAAILSARSVHPTWGPKKLRVLLERERPGRQWPARSTMAEILKRHGLVVARRRRRRTPVWEAPFAACAGPNAVWCVDFKGWFRTGDGSRCDPLTLSDAYSRYLLRCQAMAKADGASVRPLVEAAFREYGLPGAIRSDNGVPFASRGIGGLSPLSVWWIKLGIVPERIDPGQPQQNGRHERMHLTLKAETASPPAANARRQQERFEAFRREFNEVRPHEALGMRTPASCYAASPRAYPSRLGDPEYPGGWSRRRVCDRGEFRWKVSKVFLGRSLDGELVGMEPLGGRYWRVWFSRTALGVLDEGRQRLLSVREGRQAGLDESLLRSSLRSAPGAPQEPEVLPMCLD